MIHLDYVTLSTYHCYDRFDQRKTRPKRWRVTFLLWCEYVKFTGNTGCTSRAAKAISAIHVCENIYVYREPYEDWNDNRQLSLWNISPLSLKSVWCLIGYQCQSFSIAFLDTKKWYTGAQFGFKLASKMPTELSFPFTLDVYCENQCWLTISSDVDYTFWAFQHTNALIYINTNLHRLIL